jgi:hypothetical protein
MREKHEKQLPAGKATVIRSDHKQFQWIPISHLQAAEHSN